MIKGIVCYPLMTNRRKNLLVTEICSFLNYGDFHLHTSHDNLSQNIQGKTIFKRNGKFKFLAIFVFLIFSQYTVSAQIEQRCSNFHPGFFGAVALKFGDYNQDAVVSYQHFNKPDQIEYYLPLSAHFFIFTISLKCDPNKLN